MSASKRGIGSDLAYVDAYVLTEADYTEIPELTDEDFARGVVVRGGSVAVETDSALVRLDADTVATYRALGKEWETFLNDDLRVTAERRRRGL